MAFGTVIDMEATKMKTAMIIQPMNGLSEEQILYARADAIKQIEGNGYAVADTYFRDGLIVPLGVKNVPLYYLARSLQFMASCDAVYLCEGWENARGCKIEHTAAIAYGLEIHGYELTCCGDAS